MRIVEQWEVVFGHRNEGETGGEPKKTLCCARTLSNMDRGSGTLYRTAWLLPPWLSNSSYASVSITPPSSSVTLSLSPSTVAAAPQIPWFQPERMSETTSVLGNMVPHGSFPPCNENQMISELADCCRELEAGHRAWVAHKKEAAWRLRRVELQLESQKANQRREKIEEIESKIKALKEEQTATLDRIEAECKEQLEGLKRDAEAKEQKLAEQMGCKAFASY